MNDAPPPDPVNVLVLLADQHNAKCLAHAGHRQVRTPHLDRLAGEGTRFENCIAANPICTPSRISLASGQYCHNHGYYSLLGPKPGGLPTIFGHFRRFGYRTAVMGKMHCPGGWIEDDCDLYLDTCGLSRDGRSRRYQEDLDDSGFAADEEHLGYPEFDYSRATRLTLDGRPSILPFDLSQEGWIAGRAGEFIRECAESRRPFLLECSFPRPHQVAAPCQEFWDLYRTDELELPPSCDADLRQKAPHLMMMRARWRNGQWALFEPKTFEAARKRKLHSYLGAISQVDAAVGRLLAVLDEAGIAGRTIVIYTSDHGDYACEFDIMEKAPGICADAITRVPFLWRGPGVLPGQIRHEVVESVDLSQTVCHLTGIDPLLTSDGRSLGPLLGDDGEWAAKPGVTEFAWSKSLRSGDWRLVYYPREFFAEEHPAGFGELYNLADDPWELDNLWFREDARARVREMTTELLDWLVTTSRPVTVLGARPPGPDPQIDGWGSNACLLGDGYMDPGWIRNGWVRNYL